MLFEDILTLREGKQSDFNLIKSTFLKGLYYGNSWFQEIPKDIFMSNYKKVIDLILEHPSTVTTIVCLKEDPDEVMALSVHSLDGTAVHWAYVKKKWRSQGLSKYIIPKNISIITHLTDSSKSPLKKYYPSVIFNPFNPL